MGFMYTPHASTPTHTYTYIANIINIYIFFSFTHLPQQHMVDHDPAAGNGAEAVEARKLPRALVQGENLGNVVAHVEGLFWIVNFLGGLVGLEGEGRQADGFEPNSTNPTTATLDR